MAAAEDTPVTRKVALAPYDGEWPRIYEEIAAELADACGKRLAAIHHIGSTSVPGLPAKPIIDVMPGLRSHDDGLAIVETMERLGYAYHGDYGIQRRHFFTMKDGSGLARHIHCYAVGEGQWDWHLAFRDHLRAHPGDRDRYYRLKAKLAVRYPHDMESYAKAKGGFIRGIIGQYIEIDEAFAAR